jgi:hypothetical protein
MHFRDLDAVKDPISQADFRIIHHRNPDDLDHLEAWSNEITSQLDTGTSVTLVVDCQGLQLGECPNSGLCLLMAMIYDKHFDIFKNPTHCHP